jgi:hypothetical protein
MSATEFTRGDLTIGVGEIFGRTSLGIYVGRPGVIEDACAFFRGTPTEQRKRATKLITALIELTGGKVLHNDAGASAVGSSSPQQYVVFNQTTISALQAENIRAQFKHGFGKTNLNPALSMYSKLANCVEELGEIAKLLTYDHLPNPDVDGAIEEWWGELVEECLQLANLTAAWAQSADKQRTQGQAPF